MESCAPIRLREVLLQKKKEVIGGRSRSPARTLTCEQRLVAGHQTREVQKIERSC